MLRIRIFTDIKIYLDLVSLFAQNLSRSLNYHPALSLTLLLQLRHEIVHRVAVLHIRLDDPEKNVQHLSIGKPRQLVVHVRGEERRRHDVLCQDKVEHVPGHAVLPVLLRPEGKVAHHGRGEGYVDKLHRGAQHLRDHGSPWIVDVDELGECSTKGVAARHDLRWRFK